MTRFDAVAETFAPVEDGTADRCFISESYDATRFGSVDKMYTVLFCILYWFGLRTQRLLFMFSIIGVSTGSEFDSRQDFLVFFYL